MTLLLLFLHMKLNYNIYWNNIKITITPSNIKYWLIKEDFNYHLKQFVITIWVNNLLKFKSNKYIEVKQQMIYHNLINKVYEKAKIIDLDYLQNIKINWVNCWLLDNWNDICLMLPSDY